jgi:hypothetical protein
VAQLSVPPSPPPPSPELLLVLVLVLLVLVLLVLLPVLLMPVLVLLVLLELGWPLEVLLLELPPPAPPLPPEPPQFVTALRSPASGKIMPAMKKRPLVVIIPSDGAS